MLHIDVKLQTNLSCSSLENQTFAFAAYIMQWIHVLTISSAITFKNLDQNAVQNAKHATEYYNLQVS